MTVTDKAMGFTIRQATKADTELMVSLGRTCFAENFEHLYHPSDLQDFLYRIISHSIVSRQLENSTIQWGVLEQDDRPAGYVKVGSLSLPEKKMQANEGTVQHLYLLRSFQNNGGGGELLRYGLDWMKTQGKDTAYLSVWENNFGAQRFYQRFGFEAIGEFSFKVGNHYDRELVMRCDLSKSKGSQ
jgi:ribosomal protein S18 acetylase RimI-like enzyme